MDVKKKIFIIYAHTDKYFRDQLTKHLSPLIRQNLILIWDDMQIKTGIWNAQIAISLESTDIFLLVITHNFASSDYINSTEIIKAYSLFKLGKAVIFPIICDSCKWELLPVTKEEKEYHPVLNREIYKWLGQFQSFPSNGRPIKNWPNEQDGFLDVINQLINHLWPIE